MDSISLADAEGCLSELIDRVQAGEEIEIMRDGQPVARLSATMRRPKVLKPIDIEALKRHTDSMPFQEQSAGDFIREMRDSDRY